jgi:soluble lytic murein transglycosylase-like protein
MAGQLEGENRILESAVAMAHADVVQVVQRLLRESSPSLVPDGKWGNFTQQAYESAPAQLRTAIDRLLAKLGLTASQLALYRTTEKAEASAQLAVYSALAGTESLIRMVAATAREAGVDVALALRIAAMESAYNPRAKNGSSTGLFQIQPTKAGVDANQLLALSGKRQVSDWTNPAENARGAMAYLLWIARAMGGVNVSAVSLAQGAEIYGRWNLGIAGLKTVLSGTATTSYLNQARALQKYGPAGYLRAASEWMATMPFSVDTAIAWARLHTPGFTPG